MFIAHAVISNVCDNHVSWQTSLSITVIKVFRIMFLSYYPVTLLCLVGVSQPFTVSIIFGPLQLLAAIIQTSFVDKVVGNKCYKLYKL